MQPYINIPWAKKWEEMLGKRFCSKCGVEMKKNHDSLLNWVKRPKNYDRFNEKTGELIDYSGFNYKCPNQNFWLSHDDYFIRNNKICLKK